MMSITSLINLNKLQLNRCSQDNLEVILFVKFHYIIYVFNGITSLINKLQRYALLRRIKIST